jgi:hypothetical protein
MSMPSLVKAFIGSDVFEEKREEVRREQERLASQLDEDVRAAIIRKFPDEDPDEVIARHADVVRTVKDKIREHYKEMTREKLSLLDRLETGG